MGCMNTRPLLTITSGLVLATGLFAQAPKIEFPQPSPPASVNQKVGITEVSVEYCRPSVRGRKIFGGLVPYGEVWRTGANEATKITFSTDVKVGGAAVPAGSYELFTIPGKSEWTVIINKVTGQWGAYSYDKSNDVARITVKPESVATPVETFTISIGNLADEKSATLDLAWDRVKVPVVITTDLVGMIKPKLEAVMASDSAKKPYFDAAMFYYDNGLDLDKALEWMDAGLKEQPDAFWMTYRKGLILAKKGDKAGAIAAAKASLALVDAAKGKGPGSELTEYIRLNNALIKSLQ